MCRIAIVGPGWDKEILEDIFLGLEISNGGDGNGIILVEDDAVKHDVEYHEAAAIASEYDGVTVFHTRLASTGGKSKRNLHPVPAGKGWLVQNGTWGMFKYYVPEAHHDTTAIGMLIAEHGPDVLASSTLSHAGVFVYVEGGQFMVYKRAKRPFGIYLMGDKWMLVSEDPDTFHEGPPGEWYPLPDDTYLKGWPPKAFRPKYVSIQYQGYYSYGKVVRKTVSTINQTIRNAIDNAKPGDTIIL